jgi:hypothetical protein
MWEPPDQDSWLGLVKPPSLGLFGLVMPSAQAGEVALARPSTPAVRDRVILVAARRGIAAAGEPAGAMADVDRVPQRRGWLVTLGFALMEALADREWPDGYVQRPAVWWPGTGRHGLPARRAIPA